MPAGYPRTEPLPTCARPHCHARVKDPRQKYCSRVCCLTDKTGKAPQPKPAVIPKRPYVPTEADGVSFWMAPSVPREGFTAYCAKQPFSNDKKATVYQHAGFADV